MAIAITIEEFMQDNHVDYDMMLHDRTATSLQTAQATHIQEDSLAKAVLLRDEEDFLLAVLPSNRRINLGRLRRYLHRDMRLATEEEVEAIFQDCNPGAVPPFGEAYNLRVIVDDNLMDLTDVYFEAGDHENLVHVEGVEFGRLMDSAQHAYFSQSHRSLV